VFRPGLRGPAQTELNGAVTLPPAAPTITSTRPSNACATLTYGTAKTGKTTLAVPPAPGVQAKLVGDTVVITLDTGQPPQACRPKIVTIVIDDDNAAYPPASKNYPLHRLGMQTLSIPTPRSLPSPATSVQASLGLRPGFHGPDATVKITPDPAR
jgi:hypothetical protein